MDGDGVENRCASAIVVCALEGFDAYHLSIGDCWQSDREYDDDE